MLPLTYQLHISHLVRLINPEKTKPNLSFRAGMNGLLYDLRLKDLKGGNVPVGLPFKMGPNALFAVGLGLYLLDSRQTNKFSCLFQNLSLRNVKSVFLLGICKCNIF